MGECRLLGACAEEPRPKSLTTRSSPDQRRRPHPSTGCGFLVRKPHWVRIPGEKTSLCRGLARTVGDWRVVPGRAGGVQSAQECAKCAEVCKVRKMSKTVRR